MQEQYRPTQAEINLDHLCNNVDAFRETLPQGKKLLACVKANAYGHGAVEMARELERVGVDYLSVAFLDEALELRQHGITLPILVLGYTPPEGIAEAWKHDVTITLFSKEVLEAIQHLETGTSSRKLKVHIKIDSGMGRLGLLPGEEAVAFIQEAAKLKQVMLEGMFTHFAKADEKDKTYTLEQYRRFRGVVDALRDQGCVIPIIHTANSAATIDTPELSYDMVRVGISLYGLYPSGEVNHQVVKLSPVLTLKTKAVLVKTLPPHWGVSYGTRYVTQGNERIATLPIGYADGFSRMLSGKAQVLVRGRRVPVVGTICMDQCMVSLQSFAAEAEEIQAGEEVVLIGHQSGAVITADEVASQLGTIPYEVICMMAHRIPRVYTRNGAVVARINPLLTS
ncbi:MULTISPECIES: alanine racemase [Paenibacillus]|uniref:alanine racemase n=1 Tax=Paenibacillus TaxID=44249 RepID=UPI0007E42389|nr:MULTISPECIES: alanine racemase [Paenibacillus]MCZ1263536.1 alanine racemase [Paenibacillus tundrae]OAX50470.1 Alanine racemase [Paenibacillus sp. AD87]WDQ34905.1 alanine racemase [Paenibacillus marchantiae]SLK03790.1 alanine racemase [Paenibacillus sp. RU5A]SOC69422.1 alanine racemase [Paenibacillus sp. RU26A]